MRKDGKSQYQVKKEKLLKIKEILNTVLECIEMDIEDREIDLEETCSKIWEIVKDE